MAFGIGVGVLMAGCAAPTTSPIPAASATAVASDPTASVGPTSASSPSSSTGLASPTSAVVVDPGLLGHLPSTLDAVVLTPDPVTAAEVGTDPGLAASVDGVAVATAFGPTSSDAATDYAVATVVHLRPGVFSDDWFRDWRDSFDAGVCAQAGAVSGHAEANIGGHQAFIGTCAGGVHTWHVHLEGPDVIVSIQGAGPGRFGERLVDGLSG